jgi:hypothetical protein
MQRAFGVCKMGTPPGLSSVVIRWSRSSPSLSGICSITSRQMIASYFRTTGSSEVLGVLMLPAGINCLVQTREASDAKLPLDSQISRADVEQAGGVFHGVKVDDFNLGKTIGAPPARDRKAGVLLASCLRLQN